MYAFWDLSPPLPAASFRSGCRTVVILCLRVSSDVFDECLSFCLRVCLVRSLLLSIAADSARLFFVQATEPWRYRIFWIRSACTPPSAYRRFRLPPFIQAVESWLYCCSSCVCALFDTHQGIGDMVILRFRVSLCCTLGCILSCICLLYTSPSPRD